MIRLTFECEPTEAEALIFLHELLYRGEAKPKRSHEAWSAMPSFFFWWLETAGVLTDEEHKDDPNYDWFVSILPHGLEHETKA